MTEEQLEALISLIESAAAEAAASVADPDLSRPHEMRAALLAVYTAFGVQPPPFRGLGRIVTA